MRFQLLDSDYFLNGNQPVIRLFGRTESGNSVCALYDKFLPYFFVKLNEKNKLALSSLEDVKEIMKIEEVEKFIPLGYSEKPTKLLKLTLSNPQNVPKVKEQLLAENIIESSFDSDILFKYRFMVDFGLHGMDWLEIEGERAFTRASRTPAYKIKKIKPIPKKDNAELKYLSFDIECIPSDMKKPLDPKKDKIIMISMAFEPSFRGKKSLVLLAKPHRGEDSKGFSSEREMLEDFLKTVNDFDPDVMTGYNCNNFDFPFLLERLRQNKIPQNFGRCEKNVYVKTFGIMQDCIVQGRIVVDPYQILKNDPWVKFHRYTLNNIAKELLGEEKIDVEYSDIPKLWESNVEKLIEYSRKDAVLNIRLLLERGLLNKFFELAKISGLLLQDSFGGQSSRVEIKVLHEFNRSGFVMPSKPNNIELSKRIRERKKTGLKGAIVLEPKKGLHSEGCILVLDFKSLYPNIMRTYNVSPDTLLPEKTNLKHIKSPSGALFVDVNVREGIMPRVLRELLEARNEIKKEMKSVPEETKRILNAKQLALKDMANSFYGYTGYIRARLYMIDVANTITAFGRENIENTKKLIEEKFPVSVTYGDTDSIFLKTDLTNLDKAKELGEKISEFVTKNLPGYLELEFEKIYRTFLILTKKRYAGWKFEQVNGEWQDDIEMKGIETVRRDWCQLVSETMQTVLDIILKEGDIEKTINTVRKVLEKLKNNEVPLEKLTIIKGITKNIENYEGVLPHIELAKKLASRNPHSPPTPGDRIGYVIIRGNQLLSKRAEDPDYVKKKGLQIDSDYYIQNQLFSPIERILSAIGITKSEVLGSGRQVNMYDIMNNKKRNMKHEIGLEFRQKQKERIVKDWECFVCKKCNKSYRRMPLQGSCECGGELLISCNGSTGTKVKK